MSTYQYLIISCPYLRTRPSGSYLDNTTYCTVPPLAAVGSGLVRSKGEPGSQMEMTHSESVDICIARPDNKRERKPYMCPQIILNKDIANTNSVFRMDPYSFNSDPAKNLNLEPDPRDP